MERDENDRIIGDEVYFTLAHAQSYLGFRSLSGFQSYVERLQIQKWHIPKGSRRVFIKKSDLDQVRISALLLHAETVVKRKKKPLRMV